MIKIGKYKFNSKEQALEKIEALGTATDENGNSYPTHKSTIVELGYELISEAVINEEGEIVEDAVYSDAYLIDALWKEEQIKTIEQEAVLDEEGNVITPEVVSYDHPYGWKSYSVNLDHEGLHGFLGVSYLGNKM